MKRFQIIFLAAVAVLALTAGVSFSRLRTSFSPQPAVNGNHAASSSDALTPAVSPDAMPAAGPAASSSIAAVLDLATGDWLYESQADARWPVASLTKLMTAHIVAEKMDLEQRIVLAAEDFAVGGTNLTANLLPGDEYRAADLLKILLVPSSNEAAEAFARTYGRARFLAAMNSLAALWGLGATHFGDPSGLSAANQSTAREFLQMVSNIYTAHPEIFAITQSSATAVQELRTGAWKYFPSTNNFAGSPGFLGGKTGTTPTAGGNLVSIFAVSGRPVAIAVFGVADRYAATAALLQLIR